MDDRIRHVETWKEALTEIENIQALNTQNNPLWFRGQSNACWELKTTLERRRNRSFYFAEYYDMAMSIKPDIEAITDLSWASPSGDEVNNWANNPENYQDIPARDYFAYLRHNGFPSPLLDWSHSPYVAAFFAFSPEHAPKSGETSDRVALFVFLERPQGLKITMQTEPTIRTVDHKVKTHRRQFKQQSRYTICARFSDEPIPPGAARAVSRWSFVSHERVFNPDVQFSPDQDLLWKITIPVSERLQVLRHLDAFNLNAFSLFDSEESLMDTLAFRQFDVPGSRNWLLHQSPRLLTWADLKRADDGALPE